MTTIRVAKRRGYLVVDNRSVQDGRLTFAARGLHHLLLSYPDNWNINVKHLIRTNPEGRDKVYKLLKELEDLGYLSRAQNKDSGSGKFKSSDYVIHELPVLPDTDLPDTDLPDTDLPDTANTDTYILSNKQNTEYTNYFLNKGSEEKSDLENVVEIADRQKKNSSLDQKEISDSHKKSSVRRISSAAVGVSFTTKRKEPQQIVRELIVELSGDRYEEFIKRSRDRLAASDYWKQQLAAGVKITEGTILQRYARDLRFYATDSDEAIAQKIAPISTTIQTDVEMYDLDSESAPQQTYQQRENEFCEQAYRAYLDEPKIIDMDVHRFKVEFEVSLSNFLDYLEQKVGFTTTGGYGNA